MLILGKNKKILTKHEVQKYKHHKIICISRDVKVICSYTFSTFECLEKIIFESGSECEIIGNSAFACCCNLQKCILPKSLRQIKDGAFAFCSKIQSIYIPEGVNVIEPNAFLCCFNLQEVHFSSNCMFKQDIFNGCKNLKNLYIDSVHYYMCNIYKGRLAFRKFKNFQNKILIHGTKLSSFEQGKIQGTKYFIFYNTNLFENIDMVSYGVGENIHEAYNDANFISGRDVLQEQLQTKITPDTKIGLQEYRILTNDCKLGIEDFLIQQNIDFGEKKTIREIAQLYKGWGKTYLLENFINEWEKEYNESKT